ncbi:hypothetical protein ElyMa_003789200 [Elysia marginata]|uniref:Uncharacterized protein n=1 Tax=Elysia marginata TaxID=1093978 RepID=A0AAV4FC68_9GAST|nr:hypothetical protein ElyMa_003789200 [Elysia marginata]
MHETKSTVKGGDGSSFDKPPDVADLDYYDCSKTLRTKPCVPRRTKLDPVAEHSVKKQPITPQFGHHVYCGEYPAGNVRVFYLQHRRATAAANGTHSSE